MDILQTETFVGAGSGATLTAVIMAYRAGRKHQRAIDAINSLVEKVSKLENENDHFRKLTKEFETAKTNIDWLKHNLESIEKAVRNCGDNN